MKSETFIQENCNLKECMKQLDRAATGVLFIIDEDMKLKGAISDGDLRRYLLSDGQLTDSIKNCYNKNPIYIKKGNIQNKEDIKEIFLNDKVDVIPIVDDFHKIVDIIEWETVFSDSSKAIPYESLGIPVVIMAGGKGTRMEPFTKVLPKPLIPIGDKTMVEHIINEYVKYDISEFYLSINYKGNLIKAYFDGIEKEYNIDYLVETEFNGTAGSLKLLDTVPDTFIVSNCDIFVKANYSDVLKFHRDSGSLLTTISSFQHHTIPYGVVEFEKGGRVTQINEKPEFSMPINTGVYILEKEAWDYIPDNQFFHMTHLIEAIIKDGKKVMTYPVNEGDYIDIGQWKEYKNAIKKLK